ncbi:hypothetical protein FGG65_gp06 [Corynebacterium phage phi673]|uniref:Uncharacterized protein n=1 Tax=Corynebacterium phage phi673 TaxID=2052821 RepID=A0A2H4PIR5_9CAUD|nr:hypothetical protein FGG65_gp06 [Corynebacterium phage phi673]ATW62868.1 hypothetical protein phi673_gp06 [Corynebacterium phage phi673]
MSNLRRYRVNLAGGHSVVLQLDPATAKERYPEAVEVAARATGGTQTKTTTAKRTRKAAPKDPAPKDPEDPKTPAEV